MSVQEIRLDGGPQDGGFYRVSEGTDVLKVRIRPERTEDMVELQAIRARAGQPFEITVAVYRRCGHGALVFEHEGYERSQESGEGYEQDNEDDSIPF